jgi:hypothetical protein
MVPEYEGRWITSGVHVPFQNTIIALTPGPASGNLVVEVQKKLSFRNTGLRIQLNQQIGSV